MFGIFCCCCSGLLGYFKSIEEAVKAFGGTCPQCRNAYHQDAEIKERERALHCDYARGIDSAGRLDPTRNQHCYIAVPFNGDFQGPPPFVVTDEREHYLAWKKVAVGGPTTAALLSENEALKARIKELGG